jgi:hypothetical protein
MADTSPQYPKQFVRHYIEMVVVMFVGMAVLWTPSTMLVNTERTGAMLLTMAFTMTAPMVAWMRWRGHRWQPTLEMAGAMIVPTLGVLAMLAAGVGDLGVLLGIEHVAMLGGMLAAMLARRDEYAHHREVAA